MRRVDCKTCGVTVESVPWADGKNTCCHAMRIFLARWAQFLSWKQVAESFHTSWDIVFRSVSWVVSYGLENRDLEHVTALGVDEVAYQKGHHYMTLIYQIDKEKRRLLGVVEGRRVKSLLRFFRDFGKERCAKIKVICSDMWQPYLKVIKKKLPDALNVLDRFHIAKKLGEAVDQVRREEVKSLAKDGYDPILKNARYCFLKRLANLTDGQLDKLADIARYDLRTNRAYFLKEAFDGFWKYNSPQWARWFLRKWCTRTMRSRLEPMKKFVRTLRRHEDLLMNYFKAGKLYNSGIVEGLNLRINLTIRKAYGYRSFDVLKIALFHQLGELPEPKLTHKFCQ
jgi:transposase